MYFFLVTLYSSFCSYNTAITGSWQRIKTRKSVALFLPHFMLCKQQ